MFKEPEVIRVKELLAEILRFGEEDVILAPGVTRERLLLEASKNSLLIPSPIRHISDFDPGFSDDYLAVMKMDCSIDLALADYLRSAFSYRDRFALLPKEKAEFLNRWTTSLIQKKCFIPVYTRPFRHYIRINQSTPLIADLEKRALTRYSGQLRDHPIPLYGLPDKDAEISTAFRLICRWLKEGILPAHITIVNATRMDDYQLNKRFVDAGIPFSPLKPQRLQDLPKIISLIKLLKTNPDEAMIVEYLDSFVTSDPMQFRMKDRLLDMINQYSLSQLIRHPDLFLYEIRKATLSPRHISEAIRSLSLNDLSPDKATTTLILNCHDAGFPPKKLDNEFFSDADKSILGMETSEASNRRQIEELARKLERIQHVTLLYSLTEGGTERHAPRLMVTCGIQENAFIPADDSHSYTYLMDYLSYAKKRYDRLTYGTDSSDYAQLAATFSNAYQPYDPQFNGLSASTIQRIIASGIVLSATSLKRYYECPFHFLLTDILKISPQDTTLALFFGNLSHQLIESKEPATLAHIEQLANRFQADYPAELEKRKFLFLRAYQTQIDPVLTRLLDYSHQSDFVEFASEWAYDYPHPDFPHIHVKGKIDHIRVWTYRNQVYAVVLDYKTGSTQFDDDDFMAGTNPQLPFYLHLLAKSPNTSPFIPCGFYYQRILPGRYEADKTGDPIKRFMMLNGRTFANSDVFHALGGDEGWLKGCKRNQDGSFRASPRWLNKSDLDQILAQIQSLIDDAAKEIMQGQFPIKPVPPVANQSRSKSCEYCPHQAQCYLGSSSLEPTDDDKMEVFDDE
jgi:hypothetical protein